MNTDVHRLKILSQKIKCLIKSVYICEDLCPIKKPKKKSVYICVNLCPIKKPKKICVLLKIGV